MSPSASPFDPISGDLLPDYREAYVQGRLSPELAQMVENHLKESPIQTNIVLGRVHVLATAARATGQVFTPPVWVQQQQQFQPTVSGAGPLRRPVVRLVLGLFAAFILASVVQWLRNEPLVPPPVARVVVRVAQSASQATRHLAQRLTAPAAAAPAPTPVVAKVSAPRPHPHASRPVALTQAMPIRSVLVAPLPDSLAAVPAAIAAAAATTVRGRITDSQGRPLPGATVLVKGTRQATSTNANGDYELAAPVGSTLQFGYAGYADQLQPVPSAGNLNIFLLPNSLARSRR